MSAEKQFVVEMPKRNSRWINRQNGLTARVMSDGAIEGYIVARYKRSIPWVLHASDWWVKFTEARQ